MIHNARRWVAGGLRLFLFALLLVELTVIAGIAAQRQSVKSRGAERMVELFRNNCARCHGADGRGDTPLGHTFNAPDFTDPEWWRKHSAITSNRSLIAIVTRGKGGMPAFGKKLKRNDIPLLVNYVRRFRQEK
jgi:mono/diheme cytochrome c family protein